MDLTSSALLCISNSPRPEQFSPGCLVVLQEQEEIFLFQHWRPLIMGHSWFRMKQSFSPSDSVDRQWKRLTIDWEDGFSWIQSLRAPRVPLHESHDACAILNHSNNACNNVIGLSRKNTLEGEEACKSSYKKNEKQYLHWIERGVPYTERHECLFVSFTLSLSLCRLFALRCGVFFSPCIESCISHWIIKWLFAQAHIQKKLQCEGSCVEKRSKILSSLLTGSQGREWKSQDIMSDMQWNGEWKSLFPQVNCPKVKVTLNKLHDLSRVFTYSSSLSLSRFPCCVAFCISLSLLSRFLAQSLSPRTRIRFASRDRQIQLALFLPFFLSSRNLFVERSRIIFNLSLSHTHTHTNGHCYCVCRWITWFVCTSGETVGLPVSPRNCNCECECVIYVRRQGELH